MWIPFHVKGKAPTNLDLLLKTIKYGFLVKFMTYRQKYHVFDTMFCVWILHKYRPNSTYLGPHKYSVQRVTTKFMELDASQKTAATKCKGINATSFPLLKPF